MPYQSTGPAPTARAIAAKALGTYRAHFGRVSAAAFLVVVPLSLLISGLQAVLVGVPVDTDRPLFDIVLTLVYAALGVSLGSTFFSGLLDKLVGHHQQGEKDHTIAEVIRVLPYGRLWLANLILAVVTVAGLSLFVVPGVVLFTLFALVGPIITSQDCSVKEAFLRSARLVRPHFSLVLGCVTALVFVEQGLHEYLHYALHGQSGLVVALVMDGLFAATIGAVVGLIEVTITYDLATRENSITE
jgi:hypothetical protein